MESIKRKEIKQLTDFLELEKYWKMLERGKDMTVFQSFDWNRLLVEQWLSSAFNRILSKLYIYIKFDENNQPCIIVPVFVQKITVGISWIGRKKGIYLLGDSSYSDYLNFIYSAVNKKELEEMLIKIKQDLSNKKDIPFYLNCIREDTLLYEDLMLCSNNRYKISKSVYINILENEEEFYKSLSKHTRQNLRTAKNRMKKDEMSYHIEIRKGEQSREFAETLNEIHTMRVRSKNRKQETDILRKISRFFMNKHLEKKQKKYNLIVESMQSNINSFYCVVYMENEIVGYLYGLIDEKAIRIMQNCFKEEYKFYSPLFCGSYDAIVWEINDRKGYNQFDFTRGDEAYKYKLGGRELLLGYFKL